MLLLPPFEGFQWPLSSEQSPLLRTRAPAAHGSNARLRRPPARLAASFPPPAPGLSLRVFLCKFSAPLFLPLFTIRDYSPGFPSAPSPGPARRSPFALFRTPASQLSVLPAGALCSRPYSPFLLLPPLLTNDVFLCTRTSKAFFAHVMSPLFLKVFLNGFNVSKNLLLPCFLKKGN